MQIATDVTAKKQLKFKNLGADYLATNHIWTLPGLQGMLFRCG